MRYLRPFRQRRTALPGGGYRAAVLALTLAGCQGHPGGSGQQARLDNPACHGEMLSGGAIRAGDNIPVSLHVRNDGHRCWWGLRMSNQSMLAARLVNHPDHGDAILHIDHNVVAFGYLPAAGYVGGDDFLIELPTDFGVQTNLAVSVHVVP